MAEIPLKGDRSAFDSYGYPTLHASDLEAGTPVQHLPIVSSGSGNVPIWDGAKWVVGGVIGTDFYRQHVFTASGTLTTGSGDLRIYNRTARNLEIVAVYISVNTPSSGSDIIVDVNLNGTTIFTTQGNRPTITAGSYTGETTTIDVTAWNYGDNYLQVDVDQVGSGTAGADLTIHIVTKDT